MEYGITAFGAYLPYARIRREAMAAAWERKALKGERCVAGADEDSVTMAVEAALRCLERTGTEGVDALYFASVTAPYAEKSHATLAATACDLSTGAFTADVGGTVRAGASALRMALDAVGAGSARTALLAAADCQVCYPKSDREQLYGDAGAALAVGREQVVARLEARASVNTEIVDVWRNAGERFTRTGEARFIAEKGYQAAMRAAVQRVLAQAGLAPGGVAKVILTTPGLKDGAGLAKKLGFAEGQVQDSLMLTVGDCGCAQMPLMLAAALEEAAPGDRLLCAAYGNGADAFLFTVTEAVKAHQTGDLARQLARKRYLESYTRYLSFRGLLEAQPGEPFRTFPSNSAYWRGQGSLLRMRGTRCRACGTVTFPANRVCPKCKARDEGEDLRLAGRTGRVFTYSIDNLAGRSDDPVVVQTVVEDGEGCRYYLLLTDFEAGEVSIGMEVEFTFRMVYEGGGYRNYYWKCRPVRKGGEA